ncbi:ABC transporter substrate-binding protein [Sphaerisporangium sp. NBC_01403]|uniref:ABC transporter substrate-binding protein n=1 Tax=Sphaerisporangium sp. NBC_01403 TaxID=2903599 RepID=UPI00324FF6B2
MTIRIGVHNGNPSLFFLSRLDHVLDTFEEPLELYFYADGTRTGELLAEGAIDFGGTGSTPPLTAQAAGLPIVYVAASAPRPGHGALLVATPDPEETAPRSSPVRSIADLAGRPVAFGVGSWQTHFLAKLLAGAGLSYQDIEPRAVGREAVRWLRTGEIAAWVAQGADLVKAETSGKTVTLAGTAGVISNRSVFFTRRDFAETRPGAVAAFVRALQQADDWARANPREAAHLMVEAVGGSVDAWEIALARLPWRLEPAGAEFLAEQQEAADILYAADYLRRPVDISNATTPDLEPVVSTALTTPEPRKREPTRPEPLRIGTARPHLSKAAV